MTRINLYNLAETLAERHRLTIEEAQDFLENVFGVVRDGILAEGQVKVRGLGTFKQNNVEARESVNVNNGERIVIDSHVRLSFTPDVAMRELVNRPFSFFETVLLNDGVTFDEYEEEDSLTLAEEEGTIPVDKEGKGEVDSPAPALENESHAQEESAEPAEEDSSEPATEVGSSVPVAEEDASVPAAEEDAPVPAAEEDTSVRATTGEEVLAAPAEEESTLTEEVQPEEQKESEVTLPICGENHTPAPDVEGEAENHDAEEETNNHFHWAMKFALGAAAVTVLSLGVWMGSGRFDLSFLRGSGEHGHTAMTDSVSVPAVSASDSVRLTDTTVTASGQSQQALLSPPVGKPVSARPDTLPDYDALDNRIRTGAYSIVGLDYTMMAKDGETVTHLTNRTLGPGMECYIESFNGIKGTLTAGQVVKIPKLVLKKKLREKKNQ